MLLNDLYEALTPGERSAIELKINQYQNMISDIRGHEHKFSGMDDFALPGTEKELEELKIEYQRVIDALKEKLKTTKDSNGLERYIKGIVRNCPTIIQTIKKTNRMLYRGTRENAVAFYGKPYDQRNAKDSTSWMQEAFVSAMRKAGAVATRDNSIFTSTSESQASNFGGGHTYLIFPRDPFHFSWSDKERDLVLSESHMKQMSDPEIVKFVMKPIWDDPALREEFRQAYVNHRGTRPDFPLEFDAETYPSDKSKEPGSWSNGYGAFQSGSFLASFYAFKDMLPKLGPEYQKYANFSEWVSPQAVVESFGMHIDEGLEAAFKKGWEITIRGEYYAIKSQYEAEVRKLLGMSRYGGGSSDEEEEEEEEENIDIDLHSDDDEKY